jgi:hypothetical protein
MAHNYVKKYIFQLEKNYYSKLGPWNENENIFKTYLLQQD